MKTMGLNLRMAFAALLVAASQLTLCQAVAGQSAGESDSTAFRAYLLNDEFEVYMHIDFHRQNVKVPDHELFGPLPGYLGKQRNTFFWLVTSASVTDDYTADFALTNDYGSEDLTARLTRKNDSVYVFRQLEGSALKVPRNGKWQKLPKTFELKRKR